MSPRTTDGPRAVMWFILTGLCAGFAAANELPALSFACLVGLLLLRRCPRRALCFYVPAAALPLVAFLVCNFAAIGQLRPAYFEGGGIWYRYEGSYWNKMYAENDPDNIDLAGGRETKLEYAFHTVLGHHGILSLSPLYLLSVVSMALGTLGKRLQRESTGPPEGCQPEGQATPWPFIRVIQGMSLILTVVLLGFYIIGTNNYGGMTTGPRWFIWMTPLWLLSLLPVADWLAPRRWGRIVAYILLAVSVFSANYSLSNPWVHPWLYDLSKMQGFVR